MMYLKAAVFCILIFGLVATGFGQSSRDVAAPKPPAPHYQAFKKSKKEFFLFRMFKKDKKVTGREEIADFRKRMYDNARKKAKIEQKSQKPQYTNPLYFGHKKPPKKRANGKKKFCKECGLTH